MRDEGRGLVACGSDQLFSSIPSDRQMQPGYKGGEEVGMDGFQVCWRSVSTVPEELDGDLMEREPGCGFLLRLLLGRGSILT